jgi:hypothetical protein
MVSEFCDAEADTGLRCLLDSSWAIFIAIIQHCLIVDKAVFQDVDVVDTHCSRAKMTIGQEQAENWRPTSKYGGGYVH